MTNYMIEIIQLLLLAALGYYLISQKRTGIKSKSGKKIIIDTCGLIDGRIVELAGAGFMPAQIIIPQFILKELQLLADGNDTHKRARARFGLDVVKKLQTINNVNVVIAREDFSSLKQTDDKLVSLSKKLSGDLYTTDYNLNKVASIEGVRVLNVNEMALSLRPLVLPGENISVKIVQKGSGRGQGVGYLDDGTMVVVENGQKFINKTVDAQVDRYHQTDAGKMLFSKLSR